MRKKGVGGLGRTCDSIKFIRLLLKVCEEKSLKRCRMIKTEGISQEQALSKHFGQVNDANSKPESNEMM